MTPHVVLLQGAHHGVIKQLIKGFKVPLMREICTEASFAVEQLEWAKRDTSPGVLDHKEGSRKSGPPGNIATW